MPRFLNYEIPERWLIGLVGVIAVMLVLLIGGYFFIRYDEQLFRAQKIREVTVQAQILAESVAASLVFLDPEATQSYLNALMVNPEIVAADVYDKSGKKVAEYIRTTPESTQIAAEPVTIISNSIINFAQPVVTPSGTVGTVALRVLIEPIGARLQGYTGFLIALGLGATLMGILVSGLVVLTRANEKIRAEMVRREIAEEALRHSQKMESIGQLAGGIAHDFNNALAIVMGSLGLLKLRVARGENLDQEITKALEGAHRASSLTQRLLAFAHRQPLSPQRIDVNQLVTRISELFRGTTGTTIQFELSLGEGIWGVQADSSELENVLLNMMINSRDAMPDGGEISVETANAYLDESYCIEHSNVKQGEYVMIVVRDNGTGMSAEVAAKAFDPFFTTKPIGKGTGLGLSQVYGFVKQSSGHVKMHSVQGHGTTMEVYLPRAMDVADIESVPSPTIIVKPPIGTHTVLVVDDDGAVKKIAVDILRNLGYRVLHADGGSQALRVLEDHKEVDLLLTDVVMPNIDGQKLADEARRLRPELKVLFTTGNTKNVEVHEGRGIQGVHILNKPFTVEQLSLHVRVALMENVPVRH